MVVRFSDDQTQKATDNCQTPPNNARSPVLGFTSHMIPTSSPDYDIFILIQEGKRDRATECMVLRHGIAVARFIAHRWNITQDEIDDIVQDIWVIAWQKLPAFKWQSSLLTWLCAVASRRIAELHRTGRRRLDLFESHTDEVAHTTHCESPLTPDSIIMHREASKLFLGKLTVKERSLLTLRYQQNLTQSEAAQRMHVCVKTVKRIEKKIRGLA